MASSCRAKEEPHHVDHQQGLHRSLLPLTHVCKKPWLVGTWSAHSAHGRQPKSWHLQPARSFRVAVALIDQQQQKRLSASTLLQSKARCQGRAGGAALPLLGAHPPRLGTAAQAIHTMRDQQRTLNELLHHALLKCEGHIKLRPAQPATGLSIS